MRFTTMQDEHNDQVNDQSDTNRQQEQAQIPTEQSEETDIQRSKKGNTDFNGIAAHKWLKQKIFDIINGGK